MLDGENEMGIGMNVFLKDERQKTVVRQMTLISIRFWCFFSFARS